MRFPNPPAHANECELKTKAVSYSNFISELETLPGGNSIHPSKWIVEPSA
jgi:hypothetical protein